jgi:hypothetical protein
MRIGEESDLQLKCYPCRPTQVTQSGAARARCNTLEAWQMQQGQCTGTFFINHNLPGAPFTRSQSRLTSVSRHRTL